LPQRFVGVGPFFHLFLLSRGNPPCALKLFRCFPHFLGLFPCFWPTTPTTLFIMHSLGSFYLCCPPIRFRKLLVKFYRCRAPTRVARLDGGDARTKFFCALPLAQGNAPARSILLVLLCLVSAGHVPPIFLREFHLPRFPLASSSGFPTTSLNLLTLPVWGLLIRVPQLFFFTGRSCPFFPKIFFCRRRPPTAFRGCVPRCVNLHCHQN